MFSQCEKPVERRTIDTGSPLTILTPKHETPPETIEWYYAVRPPKSNIGLELTFESARFTPDYPGDYDIVAELYNDKNEIYHFKVFQYLAIGPPYIKEKTIDEIVESLDDESTDSILIDSLKSITQIDSTIKKDNVDTVEVKNTLEITEKSMIDVTQYTIQVFSLPDKQQVNSKIDLLNNAGFDSYILSFTHPKFNSTWYRVRVGKFKEYAKAESTATLIKQKLNIDTWIDRIK